MTSVQDETGVLAGEERMLIDGELQFTGSGAKFDVIHPASEEVAGQATDGTVADMERAVGAARRAFDETDWSRDLDFRYHCLTQLHEALERNKEHLRRVLITEVGCPVKVTGISDRESDRGSQALGRARKGLRVSGRQRRA